MAVSYGTVEPARSAELRSILGRSTWFVGVLETVREVSPPNWWIGAGVIRDVVWEQRCSGAAAEIRTKDVDVAFFDGGDLSRDHDELIESELVRRRPDVAWEAKNQAAVHVWYPDRFGVQVPPFGSVPEAVATWPEYAVCVAARLASSGAIEICAPHGLDDLLDGVWRRHPTRVTVREYERRLAHKQPASRWPGVRVIE
jgi:uncharacterized protein